MPSLPEPIPGPSQLSFRGRIANTQSSTRGQPLLGQLPVVLALLLYSGAARPVLDLLGGGAASGRARVIFWPMYLLLIAVTLLRGGEFLSAGWRGKEQLLFGALAVASASWSTAPEVTLGHGVSLIMATLLGLYLAVRFDQREQLRIVCFTLGIAALLSLIIGWVAPSIGVMPDESSWRGMFIHKNLLGKIMALSSGGFLLLFLEGGNYRWLALAGGGLSFGLLLLSRSVSALLIGVLIVGVTPVLRTLRLSRARHLAFLLLAVVLAEAILLAIYFEWQSLLAFFGRDPSLSGRTDLWAIVVDAIERRPWFGYGLAGFWLGWQGESGAVWSALGWRPPHAHNGFLDVMLDLGMVGLALFLVGYVVAWIKAIRVARSSSSFSALWPLSFLIFVLLSESTESTLLAQNSFTWVLYIATVCGIDTHHPVASADKHPKRPLGQFSLGVRRQLRQQGPNRPFRRL